MKLTIASFSIHRLNACLYNRSIVARLFSSCSFGQIMIGSRGGVCEEQTGVSQLTWSSWLGYFFSSAIFTSPRLALANDEKAQLSRELRASCHKLCGMLGILRPRVAVSGTERERETDRQIVRGPQTYHWTVNSLLLLPLSSRLHEQRFICCYCAITMTRYEKLG